VIPVEMPTNNESGAPLTVLIVDDEERLAHSCRRILEQEGYRTQVTGRGRDALDLIRRAPPDIVLTDLMLPDVDGITLVREARQLQPELLLIMITGFATVDSSIEAIKAGAYDYIPKPFTATQLQILVGRAARQVRLARVNAALRDQLQERYALENVIGTSAAMEKVYALVHRVAPTDASVFVVGESGTGKELVARALHVKSRRSDQPFIAINCAALPENLLESELFGHERGAFTGAESLRRGLVEHASGGTFFLDEICEMSLELQAKLLRVLQERRFRRVGGDAELDVDMRVIAATNRPPEEAVAEGRLRKDLYFRLNVVPIRLPPLRERRDDIPLLAQHYLRSFAERYDRDGTGRLTLAPEALRVLIAHDWAGNVRELQNVMERVASLALPGQEITVADLPEEIVSRNGTGSTVPVFDTAGSYHEAKERAVEAFERAYLEALLRRHEGNISAAAREADIDRKTVHRLLNKHGLTARV
jgi:two-component system, NtrC family, response regulator AtoC